jgi:hypothetical protein
MSSESAGKQRACVAGLALAALLGVVSCRERIVVGTEPSEGPSAALPGAADAGSADVAELPDADDVESEEGDDDEGDDDDDDTEDSQEEDD